MPLSSQEILDSLSIEEKRVNSTLYYLEGQISESCKEIRRIQPPYKGWGKVFRELGAMRYNGHREIFEQEITATEVEKEKTYARRWGTVMKAICQLLPRSEKMAQATLFLVKDRNYLHNLAAATALVEDAQQKLETAVETVGDKFLANRIVGPDEFLKVHQFDGAFCVLGNFLRVVDRVRQRMPEQYAGNNGLLMDSLTDVAVEGTGHFSHLWKRVFADSMIEMKGEKKRLKPEAYKTPQREELLFDLLESKSVFGDCLSKAERELSGLREKALVHTAHNLEGFLSLVGTELLDRKVFPDEGAWNYFMFVAQRTDSRHLAHACLQAETPVDPLEQKFLSPFDCPRGVGVPAPSLKPEGQMVLASWRERNYVYNSIVNRLPRPKGL